MSKEIKKVGILNSGGDCAGLNAVIASIVKKGVPMGYRFVGFEKGWEGLLSPMHYFKLDEENVRGISHLGGTILKTTNKGRFAAKIGEGEKARIPNEILKEAKANLKKLKVDALIVIGGDGTLSGAAQLAETGVNIVGVPKTIDNDLLGTDQTFGFSTAVDVVTEAIDRIHTTATSHDRVIAIETMGRHAGWIALYGGVAGGAHAILIPEMPFSYKSVVKFLKKRERIGRSSTILVVAEGAKPINEPLSTLKEETYKETLLGGISGRLVRKIEEMAPGQFELRNVVLAHTQRGGSPNSEDRILAQRYGTAAIEAVHAKKFDRMVALKGNKIKTVDIEKAVSKLKHVTVKDEIYQMAQSIGIYFGDE